VVFIKSMKSLAFATALIPLAGCAVGVGMIFAALIRAESYSPELGGTLFSRAMLGFALIESFVVVILAIVGLIYVF